MYYISVALILTELFRFEFYNKNLTLFTPISTLFRPYFDPISTLGSPGPDHFDPGGLISVSCIVHHLWYLRSAKKICGWVCAAPAARFCGKLHYNLSKTYK